MEPEKFVRTTGRISLVLSVVLLLPSFLLAAVVSLLFNETIVAEALAMQGLASPVPASSLLQILRVFAWGLVGLSLLSLWASWGLLRHARWALWLFVLLVGFSALANAIGLILQLMMGEVMHAQGMLAGDRVPVDMVPVDPLLNRVVMALTVLLIGLCAWTVWRLLTPPVIDLFQRKRPGASA